MFWLGVLVGFALMWLLISLALTAWLIWSLRRLAAAGAASIALSGCAGSWLVVSAASDHKEDKPYNENHNIIALQVPLNDEWRLVGGRYENSHYRPSRFGAAMWLPLRTEHWRLGGLAGAVDGYDADDRSRLEPIVTPVIAYERRKWGLEFLPFNGDVKTLLLKVRF